VEFYSLKRKDVMIFDSNRSDSLIKYLDLDIDKVYVLPIQYIFFLDLQFIVNLFINAFKYQSIKTVNNANRISVWYFLSIIRTVRPKVVLSLIDNAPLYSAVMKNIDDIHMIAIQNGPRPNYELKRLDLYISNYYIYGKSELDKIDNYNNINVINSYPVGSISCGYYYKNVVDLPIKYDICVISQLPNHFVGYRNADRDIGVMNTILLSDQYILEYASSHNLKLCIQLRTNQKEEIDYYKYKYGNKAILIEKKDSSYHTYKTIGESKLTIGFNSSCILEAWALERKALCIDFTCDSNYTAIIEDSLIIKNSSYDYFRKHLHKILNMSMSEYIRYLGGDSEKYIANNKNSQPHEIIKSKLEQYLN